MPPRSNALIYRRIMLFSMLPFSFFGLWFLLLQQPQVVDLSEDHQAERELLISSWENGEAIAVISNLEDCNINDIACWNGPEGISKRSLGTGYALAEDFQILGLNQADIYHNPQQRSDETSRVLFGYEGKADEKLAQCQVDEQLLNTVLEYKQANRNLIFVTDRECIAEFEQNLGFTKDISGYATMLFAVQRSLGSKPRLLGFLKAENWEAVFGW